MLYSTITAVVPSRWEAPCSEPSVLPTAQPLSTSSSIHTEWGCLVNVHRQCSQCLFWVPSMCGEGFVSSSINRATVPPSWVIMSQCHRGGDVVNGVPLFMPKVHLPCLWCLPRCSCGVMSLGFQGKRRGALDSIPWLRAPRHLLVHLFLGHLLWEGHVGVKGTVSEPLCHLGLPACEEAELWTS